MEQKKFPIRIYTKKELACLYFPFVNPSSAVHQLMNWIKMNRNLAEQMATTCYRATQRLFTPLQVELITRHLGVPAEYDE